MAIENYRVSSLRLFVRTGAAHADDVWHFLVLTVGWAPFDEAGKKKQQSLMTNTYIAALRKLAPDTGAYVNEVTPPPPLTPVFPFPNRSSPSYSSIHFFSPCHQPPTRPDANALTQPIGRP
jgi:hypothetical protein